MAILESIAATSLLGHGRISAGKISWRQKAFNYRVRTIEFTGRRIVMSPPLLRLKGIEARAVELTKEVHAYREEERSHRYRKDAIEAGIGQKPDLWPPEKRDGIGQKPESWPPEKRDGIGQKPESWPPEKRDGIGEKPELWPPENRADKPSLRNPLLRQERMGCGWLAAIFEWEGAIIEDNPELEKQAWLALAEEGSYHLPAFMLRRLEGTKNEQAISEILCWSRDPTSVKRIAARKEEIYQTLQGGVYRFCDGSSEFVDVLMHYKIPMALVSTRPRKTLEAAIRTIGIGECFSAIVAAEDIYRGKPDPEMFIYAGQLLEFIAERCIVFGNSNQTIEAAHEARMKCVAVANRHRVYELGAADLVVRRLDELSIVDLRNLADIESPEFGSVEPKPEMEEGYDEPSTSTAIDDGIFW